MNVLTWNINESKYESSTGSLYTADFAHELVDTGLAIFSDEHKELDFNE
tara:strand:+ start:522 stop:668 length:147 start_codon:yes stop_codon:yes gene_type:complete